jgi:hypothetical protein
MQFSGAILGIILATATPNILTTRRILFDSFRIFQNPYMQEEEM